MKKCRVSFCFVLLMILVLFAAACFKDSDKAENAGTKQRKIAVFIPGLMSGSPIYEMLADGVQRAVKEAGGASLTVIEAGFIQADWEAKLTTLAAGGKFDLIVSSNPSMPLIVSAVSKKFPSQRFMLFDGELGGNPSIYTLRYNQREQSYMAGFLAALLAAESGFPRIGLIAAQHYPVMDKVILPGYLEGAKTVLPSVSLDFRIIGSWSDVEKGAEIASAMISSGVKVILAISGGGNEGVAQAALEQKAQVLLFDINAYEIKPGVIAGCSILRQDKAAYDKTMLFLNGGLPFGTAEIVGIRDGYVDFADDDPLYISTLSRIVREKQAVMLETLRNGSLVLPQEDEALSKNIVIETGLQGESAW
ncbi:MAG: BMP family ABC transporter substrate-binding protein [Spirochaetaceae bacterium]|jgi:simple sugar transport system substrate-binding protein|nr:BMP family ABC transporter substrate-binding protein [Spirochaetaceae bacterium]